MKLTLELKGKQYIAEGKYNYNELVTLLKENKTYFGMEMQEEMYQVLSRDLFRAVYRAFLKDIGATVVIPDNEVPTADTFTTPVKECHD